MNTLKTNKLRNSYKIGAEILFLTIHIATINHAMYKQDDIQKKFFELCHGMHEKTCLKIGTSESEMAQALINASADIHIKNIWGDTPLHCTAQKNLPNIAKVLLENKADPRAFNSSGDTPLHIAAVYGFVNFITILSNYDITLLDQPDNNGNTALHITPLYRIIEYLIEKGANPMLKNNKNLTPLEEAQQQLNIPRVTFFYACIKKQQNRLQDKYRG